MKQFSARQSKQFNGKIVLSAHSKERLRQRVGIETIDAGVAWVRTNIERAKRKQQRGHLTHYFTDMFEIIMDSEVVVTVKPAVGNNSAANLLESIVVKEASKFIRKKKAELKRTSISVLETQLNLLRAKNPKTIESIAGKLAVLTDEKAKIEDEIKAMEIAAEGYGVEV